MGQRRSQGLFPSQGKGPGNEVGNRVVQNCCLDILFVFIIVLVRHLNLQNPVMEVCSCLFLRLSVKDNLQIDYIKQTRYLNT